jgi:hypothetical protein
VTTNPPSHRSPLRGDQSEIRGRPGGIVKRAFPTQIALASGDPFRELFVDADVPHDRDLVAKLTFDSSKGHRRLVGLTIMSKDPGRLRQITTEALRSLPLGRIQSELDEMVTRKSRVDPRTRRLTEGFRDARRPGRRGRSEAEYAAVAAIYVDHLATPAPVEETAKELNYAPSTIRAILHKARRLGLLTEERQGKAGGHLTDKAKRLLKARAEDG